MSRNTFNCGGRGRQQRRKSGICTMCKRPHPKGKLNKQKARAKGWLDCSVVAYAIKQAKGPRS